MQQQHHTGQVVVQVSKPVGRRGLVELGSVAMGERYKAPPRSPVEAIAAMPWLNSGVMVRLVYDRSKAESS
jgi:hypothetical protein